MLGIGKVAVAPQPQAGRAGPQQQVLPAASRFLQPVSKCDMSLTDLIGKWTIFQQGKLGIITWDT